MAKLIYTAIASLDGYVADRDGSFDWAEPDEEMHSFVNDLERPVGTYLYGRRMYETMVYWETVDLAGQPHFIRDYAELWRAADKVVYSSTLQEVASAKTTIERRFDVDAVRRLTAEATSDLSIGGPNLAGAAIAAGVVDEYRLFAVPVVVGGGNRALPEGARLRLELRDVRRFGNGAVYLRYRRA